MGLQNKNSSNHRPLRPNILNNGMGRKAPGASSSAGLGVSRTETFAMRNRPMPGDVRRQAMKGDATLGVKSHYTPIAQVVSGRQAHNSGSSMSVATRPRGLSGPRAL